MIMSMNMNMMASGMCETQYFFSFDFQIRQVAEEKLMPFFVCLSNFMLFPKVFRQKDVLLTYNAAHVLENLYYCTGTYCTYNEIFGWLKEE